MERFKDEAQFVLGNADAGVRHFNANRVVVRRIGHEANRHLAAFGELQRVADEVDDDLPELVGIRGERRDGRRQLGEQLHRLVAHQAFLLRHRFPDEFIQGDGRDLQFNFARFDFGQVENFVDERQQVLAVGGDAVEKSEFAGGQALVFIFEQDV